MSETEDKWRSWKSVKDDNETLVYIAGPLSPTAKQRAEAEERAVRYGITLDNLLWSGDTIYIRENIERAAVLALRVAESGYMPVCPHTNTGKDLRFWALQDAAFWYRGTLALMRACHAIALVEDWAESNGACREVIEAHSLIYTSNQIDFWRDGEILSPRLLPVEEAIAALKARGVRL